MSNNLKNQTGFSAIETVLLLVIIGTLGFTGWFVWHARQSADKTLSADKSTVPMFQKSTSQQSGNCGITPIKTPAGWKTYTNSKYKFSIAYPANWVADPTGAQAVDTQTLTQVKAQLELFPKQHPSSGPLYVMQVVGIESLNDAISDWKNSIKDAQSVKDSGETWSILDQTNCKYDGLDAVKLVSLQNSGPTIGKSYDGEFYVDSGNSYVYKFSTGYVTTSNPFADPTIFKIAETFKAQ